MRDPKRINIILNKVKQIWRRDPDIRFGQFISNFESFIKAQYKIDDLFYIEDEQMESMLEQYYEHWFGGKL